jgi:hypothetical protein
LSTAETILTAGTGASRTTPPSGDGNDPRSRADIDGLFDCLASLNEEERRPFLKHQFPKYAAALSLQEHDLEEDVDEDEDRYWF